MTEYTWLYIGDPKGGGEKWLPFENADNLSLIVS